MILVNEIKGRMVAKGITHEELAKSLGISKKTLYLKFKRGIFGSDEMFKMIEVLDIENPSAIFFSKEVTQKVT